jgi:hypothetical protein
MARVKVTLDPDLEENVRRMAVKAMQERFQPVLDQLHEQYAGRPVEEVRGPLSDAWHGAGGKISDPELTNYAEAISSGRRIVLR